MTDQLKGLWRDALGMNRKRPFVWLNWVGLPFVVAAVIFVPDWSKLIVGPALALAFALPSIIAARCFTFVCPSCGGSFRARSLRRHRRGFLYCPYCGADLGESQADVGDPKRFASDRSLGFGTVAALRLGLRGLGPLGAAVCLQAARPAAGRPKQDTNTRPLTVEQILAATVA